MNKKIFAICTILFCLLIVSCQRDNDDVPNTNALQEKIDLLVNNSWLLKGSGEDSNNNDLLDNSENELISCTSFSTWTFTTTGIIQESATTCPMNNPNPGGSSRYFLTQGVDGKIYITWSGDTYLLTFTNNDKIVHIKEIYLGGSFTSSIYMIERL